MTMVWMRARPVSATYTEHTPRAKEPQYNQRVTAHFLAHHRTTVGATGVAAQREERGAYNGLLTGAPSLCPTSVRTNSSHPRMSSMTSEYLAKS